MIRLHAEMTCTVDAPRDAMREQGRLLMEALLDLEKCNEGLHSSAVSVDAEKREVLFEIGYDTETLDDAQTAITSVIRSAIHAIGGGTPGWSDRGRDDGPDYALDGLRLAVA